MDDMSTKPPEVWASPYVVGSCAYFNTNRANGEKLALKTADWMRKNQEKFESIYLIVKELQAQGPVCRDLRGKVADMGGKLEADGFKFANALWAGVARYLAIRDSSLINNPIVFRPSDIDAFGLFPIDYIDVKEVA